jgi:hypothetical protein
VSNLAPEFETRLPARSPRIAPHNIVRIVVSIGRADGDNVISEPREYIPFKGRCARSVEEREGINPSPTKNIWSRGIPLQGRGPDPGAVAVAVPDTVPVPDAVPDAVPVAVPAPDAVLQPRPSGSPGGAPARPFPQGATGLVSGGYRRLEETTSAAYGVSGRLDGRLARRGVPPITLSGSSSPSGGRMETLSSVSLVNIVLSKADVPDRLRNGRG